MDLGRGIPCERKRKAHDPDPSSMSDSPLLFVLNFGTHEVWYRAYGVCVYDCRHKTVVEFATDPKRESG